MNSKDAVRALKSDIYTFGEFRLETENLLLLRNSEVVPLAPKACEVLLALIERGGKLITKQEILETVWADTFVEEANLTHHISALRKALGEDKNGKRFIETIPRRGYRFIAEVEKLNDGAAEIVISERTQTRISEQVEVETDDPLPENIVPEAVLPPVQTKPKSWRKAWLAGAIAVALFAVAGYGLYKFLNPAPATFEAKKSTRVTSTGRVKLAAVAPDGKLVVYSQDENDERQSLWIRHVGSESAVQIAAPADVEYRGLNISPDGNSLFYVLKGGLLYKMPLLGGAAVKIADGVVTNPAAPTSVGISPDSRQVAFMRYVETSPTLSVVNSDGTAERVLAQFEPPVRLHIDTAWSPDGRTIACHIARNALHNVFVVQVADGTFAPLLPQDIDNFSGLTWMSDSKSLLTVSGPFDAPLMQISAADGTSRQIKVEERFRTAIHLTPDSRFLATVRTETAAYIWTMPANDASRAKQLTAGVEKLDGLFGMSWMPDGKIIYDSVFYDNMAIWTLNPIDGNSAQKLRNGIGATVSPDGRFLTYGNMETVNDVGIRQTDTTDGHEKKLTNNADVWTTYSPDGKWLVFTRFAERVGLWKMPSAGGDPVSIFEGTGICPAVSPDNKTIAFVMIRKGAVPNIALVSMDGGEVIKTFDVRPDTTRVSDNQRLQWTADGKGIYFIRLTDGVSNIWQQPIDGSAPVQVTNFTDGKIFNFAFSPDESQIALSRGSINSDVVLIENAQ